MKRPWIISIVWLALSCSGGDGEPHVVQSGIYQVSTTEISGDCKLENALAPGSPFVGMVTPVLVTASTVSIDVQVCGHPDADPSCGGAGNAFDFSMARDGNDLIGAQPIWGVPGCGYFDYDAQLEVAGEVTADSELSLTWTATITAVDPTWECDGYSACSSTIRQRMAPETQGP